MPSPSSQNLRSAPQKQPSPNTGLLQALRIGRLQSTPVDEMGGGRRDRFGSTGQRLGCTRKGGGFAEQEHGCPPGDSGGSCERRFGRELRYRALRRDG